MYDKKLIITNPSNKLVRFCEELRNIQEQKQQNLISKANNMELEIPYRGLLIEIHKDIDPYEPEQMPDIYLNDDDELDEELLRKEQQDYLNGDVYGYVILDQNKQIIDSIWGYYGKIETLNIIEAAKERIDLFYTNGQL